MRNFYIRWAVILLSLLVIFLPSIWRYQNEVAAIDPTEVFHQDGGVELRVLGLVAGGSLKEGEGQAVFQLGDENTQLSVHYTGPENSNLRELKVLVVVGHWDADAQRFEADRMNVLPNYGFVTAAYLLGIFPMAIFLFMMERRSRLLYKEIREATEYQPEETFDTLQKNLYN